jgi:predicted ATPase
MLGSFRIEASGTEIRLTLPRARLLSYLILRALEDESPDEKSYLSEIAEDLNETDENQVKQVLFRLRQKLGETVLPPRGKPLIDLSKIRVDAAECWARLTQLNHASAHLGSAERASLFLDANRLYEDELLPAWNESWVKRHRKQIDDLFWGSWSLIDIAAIAAHRDARIVGYRLVRAIHRGVIDERKQACHLRERQLRQFLDALGKRRRFETAEAVFQRLAMELAAFRVSPESSTIALINEVRKARLAFESSPLASGHTLRLPPFLLHRKGELNTVLSYIDEHRLVTIVGSPGMGKTTLAMAAAKELKELFPDRVWFVELSRFTRGSDTAEVAEWICHQLGIRNTEGKAALITLSNSFRNRDSLLVLDACEFCLNAIAQIAESVLAICPRVRILATSRKHLGLRDEQTYDLPTLQLPEIDGKDGQWRENPSVALFLGHRPQAEIGLELSAPIVIEICRLSQGVPLVLELTAKQPLSLKSILAGLRRWSHLNRNYQNRLHAAILASYESLTEPAREVLAKLSIFEGGFTGDAVEYVCAFSGHSELGVSDAIQELVSMSLLAWDTRQERYFMLDMIKAFSRERLDRETEVAVRNRQLEFYVKLAQDYYEPILLAGQLVYTARLKREAANIQAALDFARQCETDLGAELCSWLWRFWLLDNNLTSGRQNIKQFLAVSSTRCDVRARCITALAVLAFYQSDFTESGQYAMDAIISLQECPNPSLLSSCFSLRGMFAFHERNDTVAGLIDLNAAAVIAESGHDDWWMSLHTINLWFHKTVANIRGARPLSVEERMLIPTTVQQCVAMAEKIGGEWLCGTVYVNAGEILRFFRIPDAFQQPEIKLAQSYFQRALKTWVDTGYKYGMIQAVYKIAAAGIMMSRSPKHLRDAAVLIGFAEGLTTGAENIPIPKLDKPDFDYTVKQVRQMLGEEEFQQLRLNGMRTAFEKGVQIALSLGSDSDWNCELSPVEFATNGS